MCWVTICVVVFYNSFFKVFFLCFSSKHFLLLHYFNNYTRDSVCLKNVHFYCINKNKGTFMRALFYDCSKYYYNNIINQYILL